MSLPIRWFLLIEAAAFVLASLVHSGVLVEGYEHNEARTAEGVIAFVLLAGLGVSFGRPGLTPVAGVGAQGFALLGTLVGIFTIAIGIGPRTRPDITYHIVIVPLLVWGLTAAWRAYTGDRRTQ